MTTIRAFFLQIKGLFFSFRKKGRYLPPPSPFSYARAYEDFKDLAKRTASDKVLRDKAFNISKKCKHDIKKVLLLFYKFFDKKSAGSGVTILQNQQIAEELHKPIIRKGSSFYYVLLISLANTFKKQKRCNYC